MSTARKSFVDRVLGVRLVQNTGSAARDFCMLERNILSHMKLALLLSVLSSSLLLQTRLVPSEGDSEDIGASTYGMPLSILQFIAAILAVVAGVWEFLSGCNDLRHMTTFLNSPKPHFAIMSTVLAIVVVTCIILLDYDK